MKQQPRKRVVIVHGWRGRPDKGWLAWLARELEIRDYEVINPQLPDRYDPKPEVWVAEIAHLVGKLDEQTLLITHSMGAPVVLRYLSEYGERPPSLTQHIKNQVWPAPKPAHIAGAIFVAGFYEPRDGKHADFFGPEPDFAKLKTMIKRPITIYSDYDQIVKPHRSKELAEKLAAEQIVLPGKAHFGNTILQTLPEVIELTEQILP